jgi:hypothetical protein
MTLREDRITELRRLKVSFGIQLCMSSRSIRGKLLRRAKAEAASYQSY